MNRTRKILAKSRTSHKYKNKKPDGKGGWIYEYDDPKAIPAKAAAAAQADTMARVAQEHASTVFDRKQAIARAAMQVQPGARIQIPKIQEKGWKGEWELHHLGSHAYFNKVGTDDWKAAAEFVGFLDQLGGIPGFADTYKREMAGTSEIPANPTLAAVPEPPAKLAPASSIGSKARKSIATVGEVLSKARGKAV